jgi:transcriptional regulator with XRE-family HTH domain
MSHLGRLLLEARQRLGWTPEEAARQAGYVRIQKGVRHLSAIERGEDIFPEQSRLGRFAKSLGVEKEAILQAQCSDWEELDRPCEPRVIIRIMPSIYQHAALPPNCTTEQAIEIASAISKERRLSTCVVLSRIRGLYLEPDGTRKEVHALPGGGLIRLKPHALAKTPSAPEADRADPRRRPDADPAG